MINRLHTQIRPAPLAKFLSGLAQGPRQSHKSLSLWPLLSRADAEPSSAPPYSTLADALEAGTLRVDEVSDGGSVPHVLVENLGGEAVLVLFGEELRGAKQNRVANASFLIGPASRVVIDVSCVEHGRWSRRAGTVFSASREVLSPSMRRPMAQRVSDSRRAGRHFDADQGEVWADVALRLSHVGSRSPTSAYADYAASRHSDVQEFLAPLHALPQQVGFVAAIGDEVVGLEAIGRTAVFASAFAGLVRGYAIDAVDAELMHAHSAKRGATRGFDAPEPFLDALASVQAHAGSSLGLGEDLRFDGGPVAGCALVAGDLVHLTAFPAEPV